MENVYIIGLGMIRFGKHLTRGVREMAVEATNLALADAGLSQEDLQACYFSNTFWGMYTNQHSIRGEVTMRSMGIGCIPVVNVENACAGASTALHLAYTGVRAGQFDVALALGSEKITHENKAMALGAYASCMDLENIDKALELYLDLSAKLGMDTSEQDGTPGQGRSIFMDAYAMGAKWHMKKFGSTQRQLAAICAKNHWHGSLNPLAQYQQDMTVEEVLNDKPVAFPLTRAMCAPIGDGAAAAVICSESYLKKLTDARPVKILASVLGTGRDRDIDEEDIGERLVKKAYDIASVGPKDISLAELHDATSYGELHQTEAMGFCPMGEGGPFAESGATKIGGRLPVNTSGGLECRGHPIGASGLAQIYEIGLQLRGEAEKRQVQGARMGLAENGGGNIGVEEAAMCIHILEKAN